MITEYRSVVAGALFGLAAVLVIFGIRRLLDDSRAPDDRRKGFWPMNAGLVMLALSIYLITDTS